MFYICFLHVLYHGIIILFYILNSSPTLFEVMENSIASEKSIERVSHVIKIIIEKLDLLYKRTKPILIEVL
jgi:hypothetical protein